MIISLRKWLERAKFVLFFLALTFLLHYVLTSVAERIQPRHRFEEPSGGAVKAQAGEWDGPEGGTLAERLRFFYWYGE